MSNPIGVRETGSIIVDGVGDVTWFTAHDSQGESTAVVIALGELARSTASGYGDWSGVNRKVVLELDFGGGKRRMCTFTVVRDAETSAVLIDASVEDDRRLLGADLRALVVTEDSVWWGATDLAYCDPLEYRHPSSPESRALNEVIRSARETPSR